MGKANADSVSDCSRYLLVDLEANIVTIDSFKCAKANVCAIELSGFISIFKGTYALTPIGYTICTIQYLYYIILDINLANLYLTLNISYILVRIMQIGK